jgi:excisionase family DNA binding protein
MTNDVEQLSLLDPSEPPTPRQEATPSDTPPQHGEAPAAPAGSLLTTHEAASLLRIHARTVQRLVERGELCAVHLGCAVRFDPRDIAALVERVKRGGPRPRTAADTLPARRPGSVSFVERLRSQRDEHRAPQA